MKHNITKVSTKNGNYTTVRRNLLLFSRKLCKAVFCCNLSIILLYFGLICYSLFNRTSERSLKVYSPPNPLFATLYHRVSDLAMLVFIRWCSLPSAATSHCQHHCNYQIWCASLGDEQLCWSLWQQPLPVPFFYAVQSGVYALVASLQWLEQHCDSSSELTDSSTLCFNRYFWVSKLVLVVG